MKRKSVMRLLAVAVAASVAVTSPSLPASLVTVQAGELSGSASIVLKNTNSDPASATNMVIGETLTVSGVTGDATPTYQWYHDSISDGNEITDATNAEYTLVETDYDKVICVKVTAGTNDSGDPLTADTGSYKVVKKTITQPTVGTVATNAEGNGKTLTWTVDAGTTYSDYQYTTTGTDGYQNCTEEVLTIDGTTATLKLGANYYAANMIGLKVKATDSVTGTEGALYGQEVKGILTGLSLTVNNAAVDASNLIVDNTIAVTGFTTPEVGNCQFAWTYGEGAGTSITNTGSSYQLTDTEKGSKINVTVSSTNYDSLTLSTNNFTVGEAAATTVEAQNPTEITVNPDNSGARTIEIAITNGATADKYEYSLNGGTGWIKGNATTTGVSAVNVSGSTLTITLDGSNTTAYAVGTIKARLATDTQSEHVVANTKILTAALTGTVDLKVTRNGGDVNDGTIKPGDIITASLDATPAGATLQYKFTGSTEGTASETATYEVTGDDLNKTISVEVTDANGLYTSSLTKTTSVQVTLAATEKAATPAGTVDFSFEPNDAGDAYTIAITYSGSEDYTAEKLVYSTDGTNFFTKGDIEKKTFAPDAQVTVTAKVAETTEKLESETKSSEQKKAPTAPEAPTISVSSRNIVVSNASAESTYQISYNSGDTWQNVTENVVSTTLTIPVAGNIAYAADTIQVRVAKTTTTVAGAAAKAGKLTAALAGTVTLEVKRGSETVTDSVKVGDVITAKVDGAQTGTTLNYTFTKTKDNVTTTAQAKSAKNTYTVTKDDIGSTITVKVEDATGDLYTNSITPNAATAAVEAKDAEELKLSDVQGTTPTAQTTNNASYKYTYAPKDTTGLEFQVVEDSTTAAASGSWTTDISSWTNGFTPGKTYTFYARRAEDKTNGVAAGTEVRWTVEFPKLQHTNLVLNYKIETSGSDRVVTITQPSDNATASYEYTFDGTNWSSTYTKSFTDAVGNVTPATIGIKYKEDTTGVFASDGTAVTESVADVNDNKAATPTGNLSFVFKVNDAKTAYNLTITYDGQETGLEYSTDGTNYDTKANIEGKDYAAGSSVTVYVRVAKADKTLASNSLASTPVTATAAPAAPTTPTLTFTLGADNKYTLKITPAAADDGKTLEYSTDNTTFSADTKTTLEGKTYAPGEAVTVYVRVAGSETSLVSDPTAIVETAPAKATAPTITITSGSVTITAEGYTIRYTTDGTDPTTTTGTVYDAAFPVTDGTTVKAIAYANNIVTSDVASKTYTVSTSNGTTTTPSTGKDKTDTDTSTTTEPTLTKNEDGDKVIVDADGKVIADELVTIDGKSYVTDENGEVLTSQIAEVGDVKVYVGKNGVVATDKAVTYEGKKYYATETGEIATNSFVTTARGNMVYATKTGALKTSTAFTVAGKKYYAKASGVIATTGFVTTAKGNTVYATKTGALQVNKAFKASNGKKYVADKNGKIVKGKKITIGKKTYTTNKKGVIVKVTTK